jgi:SAM-dependent MidA family methyltransferase
VREDGLRWDRRPAPSRLETAVDAVQQGLPQALAQGYHSEICLDLAPWLGDVTRTLQRGLALFIDYGYPRSEYYLPARREGTLVCQYRHRAHFDPFVFPGLQDISAFVDFTALAEAADAAGLEVAGYSSQAMFLLACDLETAARSLGERLAAQDGSKAELRQRQALAHELRELTLPGAMGEKFQCMGLTRGLDISLRGFELLDLRGRL